MLGTLDPQCGKIQTLVTCSPPRRVGCEGGAGGRSGPCRGRSHAGRGLPLPPSLPLLRAAGRGESERARRGPGRPRTASRLRPPNRCAGCPCRTVTSAAVASSQSSDHCSSAESRSLRMQSCGKALSLAGQFHGGGPAPRPCGTTRLARPMRQRLLRVHRPAGEDQVHGPRVADQARQAHRCPGRSAAPRTGGRTRRRSPPRPPPACRPSRPPPARPPPPAPRPRRSPACPGAAACTPMGPRSPSSLIGLAPSAGADRLQVGARRRSSRRRPVSTATSSASSASKALKAS